MSIKNETPFERDVASYLGRIADHLGSIRESLVIIARNSNHSGIQAGIQDIMDAIDRQGPNMPRKRVD